jgi:hypothetical protein
MRQQLLGYLLGALDAPEQDRVEKQVQQDPQLCERLEELDASLEPLRQQRPLHVPPEGLAQRTCQFVEREIEQRHVALASDSNAAEASAAGRRRWSLNDMIVAGGVIAAAALLFFPAIASSRFQSQKTGCKDHLRRLHVALMQYADANHGFFPAVPPQGKLSFAGIYGPLLHHGGYAVEPSLFFCPAVMDTNDEERPDIPTLMELRARQGRTLAVLQRRSGGNYGYTLGIIVNGAYSGVRERGRVHFAVMADAPSAHLAGRQSDNHAGRGQNVLYEDGHVHFLLTCQSDCDNVFLSERNLVEAGRHWDDAVLGPSTASPIPYPFRLTSASR